MLTKEEQETIINFNESDNSALIEVPVGNRIYKRLLSLGLSPVHEFTLKGKVASVVFEIPKGWIKVNPGRKLTEQQKMDYAERARKNFAANNTKV